jgi:hypothetical protein
MNNKKVTHTLVLKIKDYDKDLGGGYGAGVIAFQGADFSNFDNSNPLRHVGIMRLKDELIERFVEIDIVKGDLQANEHTIKPKNLKQFILAMANTLEYLLSNKIDESTKPKYLEDIQNLRATLRGTDFVDVGNGIEVISVARKREISLRTKLSSIVRYYLMHRQPPFSASRSDIENYIEQINISIETLNEYLEMAKSDLELQDEYQR